MDTNMEATIQGLRLRTSLLGALVTLGRVHPKPQTLNPT